VIQEAVRYRLFRLALTFLTLAILGITAKPLRAGDILYDFIVFGDDPIQPVSFRLDEPDFLTPGIYSIPNFNLTDGVTTWTFTQMELDQFGPGANCIVFGTSNATLLPIGANDCGALWSNSFPSGLLFAAFDPLTSTGSYVAHSDGRLSGVDGSGAQAFDSAGTVTLSLAEAPEPSTWFAAAILALVALVWRRRRTPLPQSL
jgi:hypothetical protein